MTYDYETPKTTYLVEVKANDGREGIATISVTINVTDVNEVPQFPSGSNTRSIAENTPQGRNVGAPVAAEDPDPGDTLTYTLGGPDSASFDIVESSGQLLTNDSLAKENKSSYSVTVSVTDGRDADGNANASVDDTITITIDVSDLNDPPEFESDAVTLVVLENTAPGGNVGAPVVAKDPDRDTLTYTLEGTDASSFTIDSEGQIKVGTGTTLDRETKSIYDVDVSVRDSKDDNGNPDTVTDDTIMVTINVTDQNEPPEITAGSATVDYAENGTSTVETYTATDPEGATIAWSLSGADAGDFSITQGELTFRSPPDQEVPVDQGRNNIYLVTVITSDGPNSGTLAVQVTVTNVNEPPSFSEDAPILTIPENIDANGNVGSSVTAKDPENDPLTYSLSGSDASSFTIDSGTGQVKVAAGITLDYDTKPNYNVMVSVSDNKDEDDNADPGTDATITATINVAEESGGTGGGGGNGGNGGGGSGGNGGGSGGGGNGGTEGNVPQMFSNDADTRDIPENSGPDINVGVPLVARGPNGHNLTYTLEGADRDSFAIDDQTRQIKTKAGVTYDHEAKSSYAVMVKADDGNGSSGTVSVTINVTDVDEPPLAPAAPRVSGLSTRSVSVTWSPPDNAGRPSITQYEYQYKKTADSNFDAGDRRVVGTATNSTINSLQVDTSYDVQVRAYNDERAGQWSPSGTGSTDRRRPSSGGGGGGSGGGPIPPPPPSLPQTPESNDDTGSDASNDPSGEPVEPPPTMPTVVPIPTPSPTSTPIPTMTPMPTLPPPTIAVPEAKPDIVKASDDKDKNVAGSGVGPTATPTPTPTVPPTPTSTPVSTPTPTPEPTDTPVPTPIVLPTPSSTATPTPLPTPSPTPVPTPTPIVVVTPTPPVDTVPQPAAPDLERPGIPVIGDAASRIKNTLEGIAATPRERMTLIVILAVVSVLSIGVSVYLFLRRC